MSKQLSSMALTAFVAALLLGMPGVEAKQQCSAAMPSSQNGKWWSYRLIDGRKCWYEGKPGLSKALLAWPKGEAAQPLPKDVLPKSASAQPSRKDVKDVADIVPEKRFNPLDAQAWAPKEAVQNWAPEEAVQARTPNYIPETFDALWSGRIWLLGR
ncbi:hypothetical protein CQ14_26235 [Bradyrhizobium lablabi]|uniref:Uncharacterized protein n=1 Tax=Bradyrhizobium lablabi TaxID=722472 RepID=A0A0R3MT09_9BRAD|nr:hypothetical protein [Bradyrhizobium lablabi]KRR20800.1 hypothetical protein CQ14_26235 [Bradyrhizobium lablabi]